MLFSRTATKKTARGIALLMAVLVMSVSVTPVHAAQWFRSEPKVAASSAAAMSKKYKKGIDVSCFQGTINWKKVRAAGVDYAFIRAGYRGSSTGKLAEDSTFRRNLKGATAAGIECGVYFFTQAITEQEAREEAKYTINLIKATGCKVNLPIIIDTESGVGKARANGLSKAQRTKVMKAFCDQVRSMGDTPMIYTSTSWLNTKLDMSKLSSYLVWVAQYNSTCTYKGKYKCWQYTNSGKVNGISGRVDMNRWIA